MHFSWHPDLGTTTEKIGERGLLLARDQDFHLLNFKIG
jgi:hypothetical protein